MEKHICIYVLVTRPICSRKVCQLDMEKGDGRHGRQGWGTCEGLHPPTRSPFVIWIVHHPNRHPNRPSSYGSLSFIRIVIRQGWEGVKVTIHHPDCHPSLVLSLLNASSLDPSLLDPSSRVRQRRLSLLGPSSLGPSTLRPLSLDFIFNILEPMMYNICSVWHAPVMIYTF